MKLNKIPKLKREKIKFNSRKNYLRLDKNERVTNFHKNELKNFNFTSFDLSAYPEVGKIYKLLSKSIKISINNLILTPGSDFGYRICFEFFCRNEKKKIIVLNPTFGMIDVYSKIHKVKKINIEYNINLELDLKKLKKNITKNISAIFLANPNSPTGTIIDKNELIEIITRANKLNIPVILDEAYYGFYKHSFIKYIKDFGNLIILRTFSKSFGLAGLRAGYIISNKKIINELNKFKPMYEINSIACYILEVLLKKPNIVENYVASVNRGKIFFEKKLKILKINFLPTYANFIHIDLGSKKKMIEKSLYNKKILTRKGPGVKGLENYLRITLGPIDELKKVLKVLNKFF